MHCCGKCSACRKLKEGGFALRRRKGSGKCYCEMETETTVGISPMNAQLGSCDGSTQAEVASRITLSFEVLPARLARGELRGDTGKSVHGLPRDHFERAPPRITVILRFFEEKSMHDAFGTLSSCPGCMHCPWLRRTATKQIYLTLHRTRSHSGQNSFPRPSASFSCKF